MAEAREKNEVLTGLFYLNPGQPSFTDMLNLVDQPIGTLPAGDHTALEERVRGDYERFPVGRCGWTASRRGEIRAFFAANQLASIIVFAISTRGKLTESLWPITICVNG